ncbi:MAG: hypothetical protein V7K47_19370 [Nostoc sp.]
MACQLTINYSSNYGGGSATFDVPDGSYQSAYVYWYPGVSNPRRYDVRSDGEQGTVTLAGSYYPPNDFNVSYDSFSNTCAPPIIAYDCINGACIKKSVYNTPGLYTSLSECETACGTGCSGKCIPNSEWAQIEGLANQLKLRNCS